MFQNPGIDRFIGSISEIQKEKGMNLCLESFFKGEQILDKLQRVDKHPISVAGTFATFEC